MDPGPSGLTAVIEDIGTPSGSRSFSPDARRDRDTTHGGSGVADRHQILPLPHVNDLGRGRVGTRLAQPRNVTSTFGRGHPPVTHILTRRFMESSRATASLQEGSRRLTSDLRMRDATSSELLVITL